MWILEIIASKFNLERTIYRLLLFEGHKFLLRHYDAPPNSIPILNLVSFDDDKFYIRDFYPSESIIDEKTLVLSGNNSIEFFRDYWSVLWNEATPLNQGGIIDWKELHRISIRIGLSTCDPIQFCKLDHIGILMPLSKISKSIYNEVAVGYTYFSLVCQ